MTIFLSADIISTVAQHLAICNKSSIIFAGVAELADAPDLGSGVFDVGVQVPSPAPYRNGLCSVPIFLFRQKSASLRLLTILRTLCA